MTSRDYDENLTCDSETILLSSHFLWLDVSRNLQKSTSAILNRNDIKTYRESVESSLHCVLIDTLLTTTVIPIPVSHVHHLHFQGLLAPYLNQKFGL